MTRRLAQRITDVEMRLGDNFGDVAPDLATLERIVTAEIAAMLVVERVFDRPSVPYDIRRAPQHSTANADVYGAAVRRGLDEVRRLSGLNGDAWIARRDSLLARGQAFASRLAYPEAAE